jgi:hypothetical protein
MIAHKTFTELTVSLTGEAALAKQEKLRKKAEEFIANELNDEDVINVTETIMSAGRIFSIGGLFSVTIWHRKR